MANEAPPNPPAPATEAAAAGAPATATAPIRRSLPRRALRWLLWIVVAVVIIEGLLWLAVPPLARWQGQKIATEELGRPVTIGKIEFKPWSLELTVRDVAIGGLPGQPQQFTVKRVYVNASIQSLLKLGPVLDAVQIDDPVLRLTRLDGNHYDIDDIVSRLTSGPRSAKPSQPLNFALYNIVLQGGQIDLDDRVVGRMQKLTDLHLAVPFISDLPAARDVKVQPQLAFTLNGSRFESHADALPFDPSRRTEASFKVAQFDLEPYLGYLPADLPLKLQAGVVDADLRLTFEQTPKPALHVSGTVDVSKLKAADAKGAEALAFDALKVQLADVQPLAQQIHLASVELDNPSVDVRRDASGAINLVPQNAPEKKTSDAHTKSPEPAAQPAKAAADANTADAPKLALMIDKFAVHGGSVAWRDDDVGAESAPPAAIRVGQLELSAQDFAYPMGKPFKLSGSAALDSGTAAASAPAQIEKKDEKDHAPAGEPARKEAAAPVRAALKFDGQVSPAEGAVAIHTAGLPLALAAPYLAAYLEPHLSGTLGADARVQWAPARNKAQSPAWTVTARHVQLDSLLLAGAGATAHARRNRSARPDELASIAQLQLADVKVDPQAEAVTVGRIAIKDPRVVVERDEHQHWMFERWLRTPGKAEPAAAGHKGKEAEHAHGKAAPHWAVRVNALALEGGTVGWIDESTPQPVRAEITDLQVGASKLDLDGKRPVGLDVSARIGTGRRSDGEPGRLSWRGEVAWTPVSANGTVDAVRLPLQAFEPYVHDSLNVRIARAEGSFKGHVAYTETEHGPRVQVKGDARVDDLRTFTRPGTAVSAESAPTKGEAEKTAVEARDAKAVAKPVAPSRTGVLSQELFSTRQLSLGGLDVQLAPGRAPQITIGHTLLSGFFARIVISPSGRINLQDIANSGAAETREDKAPTKPEATAKAEAHAAPNPLAPVIRFGPTRLVNGHIDFTDHFIRPNYSADLTRLDGSLGAFSSVTHAGAAPQMAELKLTGTAEGSAALDVEGQINPLADPLALDIKAKVTDLDLPPLSPYAIKYSGHGIERGKLSMDVAYKIQPDGQLTATNKLVLNQLQFGASVPGAPASLPVQLATALLADSDGVINLDLPISGSINDPEFSIGPIIFKAVMNLIGKAITAPFTLLAHALGSIGASGQDMSQVVFAPGSAQLSVKARTQLDGVAKALADRPNLKLTVAGTARLADEEEGAKRQRLYAMVAAEERHEAPATAAEPGTAAAQPADVADIASSPAYSALLKRLYRRDDIPGKPRNFIGMQRSIPVAEMEKLMMDHIHVGESAMRQLAEQRAVAVKDYLASKGIAATRLFLGAVQTGSGAQDKGAAATAGGSAATSESKPGATWTPHAELSLGMN